MSAKAKRIGKCIFDIHLYITVSYIIQVTLFIRHLITNSLMDQAFLKFFYTGDHFHCTGSSQKMSCNRFCRIYFHFFCVLTKCFLNGNCFK